MSSDMNVNNNITPPPSLEPSSGEIIPSAPMLQPQTTVEEEQDTLETTPLEAVDFDRLSLIDYARRVGAPKTDHEIMQKEIDAHNPVQTKQFYQEIIDRAINLRKLRKSSKQLHSKWESLVDGINVQIEAQQTLIVNYNGLVFADQLQVNLVNSAINNYKLGLITSFQLQIAVNNYNAYVASRQGALASYQGSTVAYNGEVPANNAEIAEFNQLLIIFGFPPIPPQGSAAGAQPFPPIILPVPIPPPALFPAEIVAAARIFLPGLTELPDPPPENVVDDRRDDRLDQIEETQLASLANASRRYRLADTYLDVRRFNNRGNKPIPFEPNDFIQEEEDIPHSRTENSSAGLSSQLTGLDSKMLEESMSQALFLAALGPKFNQNVPETFFADLQFLGINLLQFSAFAAAFNANNTTGSLINQVRDGSQVVDLLFSFELGRAVNVLIGGEEIDKAITELLDLEGEDEGKNLTEEEVQEIVERSKALLTTRLLEFAVLDFAKALNAPGLISQLLAGALASSDVTPEPISDVDLFKQTIADSDVVFNLLLNPLSEELNLSTGLSSGRSTERISNALRSPISFSDIDNLPAALKAAFQGQGIDGAVAAHLSSIAIINLLEESPAGKLTGADLESEPVDVNVNALFSPAVLDRITSTLSNEIDRTELKATLEKVVSREGGDRLADLRNNIVAELQLQGFRLSDTIIVANRTAELINSERVAQEAFSSSLIQEDVLRGNIEQSLINDANFSEEGATRQAEEIARETILAATVFGSETTFRETLRDRLVKSAGLEVSLATQVSLSVDIGLQRRSQDVLQDIGLTQTLSRDELVEQINSSLIEAFTPQLDLAAAQRLADEIIATFIGAASPTGSELVAEEHRRPTSVYNRLEDATSTLIRSNEDKISKELSEDFRETMSLNIDPYMLYKAIMDPANHILKSENTGLMYQQQDPTREKVFVPIQI